MRTLAAGDFEARAFNRKERRDRVKNVMEGQRKFFAARIAKSVPGA
jgi:hypothetical protein